MKSHEQFIKEIKALGEELQNFRGVRGSVRKSVRRLWNVGSEEGGATLSYEQAKNLSRNNEVKNDKGQEGNKYEVELAESNFLFN